MVGLRGLGSILLNLRLGKATTPYGHERVRRVGLHARTSAARARPRPGIPARTWEAVAASESPRRSERRGGRTGPPERHNTRGVCGGPGTAWGGGDADPEVHTRSTRASAALGVPPPPNRSAWGRALRKFLSVRFSGRIYRSSTQVTARCWSVGVPGVTRPHQRPHLSSSDCVSRSIWAKASILLLSRALRKE